MRTSNSIRKLPLLIILSAWLAACGGGGSGDGRESAGDANDAGGENITSADGLASVSIPADAMSKPTDITIEPASSPPAGGRLIGKVYDFGPSGTKFKSPVTITIAYEAKKLPIGVAESSLAVVTYDGKDWVPIADNRVNAGADTVSGETDHFSLFGLMYANSPPLAQDGSLTVAAGDRATGTLGATDIDNDPLDFSIVSNANSGTATITNFGTGIYHFVADPAAAGTDSFTFLANDGTSDSNLATVHITYGPANGAPEAQDFALDTISGVEAGGTLSAVDPNGDPMTFSIVQNGTLGTATIPNPASPVFTYLAPAGTEGTDTFIFRASDGQAVSSPATVTVNVRRLHRLSLIKSDFGAGDVYQVTPAGGPGLDCDYNCTITQFEYPTGTTVVLAVTYEAGSTSVTWKSGCDSVNGNRCTMLMDASRIVEVEFEPAVAITSLPYDDHDGHYTIGWSCTASGACSPGQAVQYVIQEDSNPNFFDPVDNQFVQLESGSLSTSGSRLLSDRGDGTYYYRIRPASSISWSRTQSIRVGRIERESVDSSGRVMGDGGSGAPSISAFGEHVAFSSSAGNLVANGANGFGQVFVRNTRTGVVRLVSKSYTGALGNGHSRAPVITPNGRFVAFHSWASDLVANDSNNSPDYFVHDLATGTTERVSVTSLEAERTSGGNFPQVDISADGRFVVFMTDQDLGDEGDGPLDDIYLRDRLTGTTILVTPGRENGLNLPRRNPKISASGRWVVYESMGSAFTLRNTRRWDIYLWDRITNQRLRVSTNGSNTPANDDSREPDVGDFGWMVTFTSDATNLAPTGDANGVADVFVKNLHNDDITRLSQRPGPGNSVIEGNARSFAPTINQAGDVVVFTTDASNLRVSDDNGVADVYLRDLASGSILYISKPAGSGAANNSSGDAAISPEGLVAGFRSSATNLTSGMTDGDHTSDVFTWNGRGTSIDPGLPTDDADNDGIDTITELTETFTAYYDHDPDRDGFSDSQELAAGTDPWNVNERPR